MDNDTICYKKFLDGDILGFEELVIKYKNNLIFFIMKYIKDINISEDLAQDAFVEIFVHKDRYNFKKSFKTYLFTIARNKAIDYIRKYGREIASDEIEVASQVKGLEEKVFAKDDEVALYRNLEKLKKEYSIVIHLIDLEQLTYKEAANIMNKTVPQIKVLIHRARKSLEKFLREEGFNYEDR